jgi:hypothetical protein
MNFSDISISVFDSFWRIIAKWQIFHCREYWKFTVGIEKQKQNLYKVVKV